MRYKDLYEAQKSKKSKKSTPIKLDQFNPGSLAQDVTRFPEGIKSMWPGNFNVTAVNLDSLEGGPSTVLGNYTIARTNIKTLGGAPKEILGNFRFGEHEKLVTLIGFPKHVHGNVEGFDLTHLTSLTGMKECEVDGDIHFTQCGFHNLIGLPKALNSSIYIDGDALTSLEGAPSKVRNTFHVDGHFTTLSGLDITASNVSLIGEFATVNGAKIKCKQLELEYHGTGRASLSGIEDAVSGVTDIIALGFFDVLGLLFIPALKAIHIGPCSKNASTIDAKTQREEITQIVSKYLGSGADGLLECQMELVEAGYEDYASF